MKVSKPVLFQFLILSIKLCYCLQRNTVLCPEIEKRSLLTFKQSLEDPYDLLSSWDGEVDCCKWKCVVCNNSTGHVHLLNLQGRLGQNAFGGIINQGLSGKINPSLVNLKYLTHLDLSQNNFDGETIPSFIGSFTNLQYLNLSFAGFQGKISSSIGNLSILHTLDLDRGWYYSDHELEADSVEWLWGLSKLEHLNMNGANLSRATNWAKVITSLPSLLELHFSGCTLDFMSPLNVVNHSTSLTLIDLSHNEVYNQSSFPVPRWFFQLNNLLSLDLSRNSFTGPFPTVINATKLHLGNNQGKGLSGKINPSLVNLKYLTHLDLSLNEFYGEPIPSFIGSFTNLQYLNLSWGGFGGMIPSNIGNLSNLLTLDLDSSLLYGVKELEGDSLEWLLGLPKLEYLNMNGANLSRATNWAKVITSLPSLLELHFSGCTLDFMSPLNVVNLSTSLTLIDLSDNIDYGQSSFPIPRWFFQLHNLLSLDLSGNSFTGSIPTFINATKLRYIDLGGNHFNSSIPDWLYFCKDLEFLRLRDNGLQGEISDSIGNLTSLKSLDLSNNQLSGKLPREITSFCRIQTLDLSSNKFDEVGDFFGNMSGCFLGSLKELRLRSNQLYGHLTEQVGEFKSLRYLDLASNSLSGAIPVTLGNLSSLEQIWLDDNNFTDNIPKSLGQLSNLQKFYIENNKLEGIVTESHFVNLSKLVVFSASGNHLTLDVGQDWIPPIQLDTLQLRSWRLGVGSEIPSWLRIQRNIMTLDLSDTGISGSIPSWFLNVWFLNISHNNLHGKIPNMIGSTEEWAVQYLYLSYNNFSGPLPRIEISVADLDLSHNSFSEGISGLICNTTNETYRLQLLNLEGNRLSGELPDCWEKWSSLTVLKLGNNTLSGSIPNSIWSLPSLISLSIHDNKLSGHIPAFTGQTNTELLKIDLSHNNLDGNLPTWMGASLLNLKILILRSNNLSGMISSQICHLQSLQILDLSNNLFSSIIPQCVSNFTAMVTKRLLELDYHYHGRVCYNTIADLVSMEIIESASIVTKGVGLEYSTTLSLVTNIDLSMNNLSGEIPKELTSLVELRSLNLSGNHFTGWIPESIGAMKQLESLDFSQNSLSGQIPNGLRLLSSLSHLNLSFNKLRGRIPESTQLQSLNASSFIGNDLCGPPLTSNCSRGGDGHEREEKEGHDEKSEIKWLYVLLSLGYAVGFSAACTALVVKKSWRDAYFGMLECTWDKIYVYLYVKWASLSKPAASTLPS